ncbi:MAG: hypothetical protein A2176_06840 [Spirochaetes bacterium RBG_13_51_14]|nr:MAG: hypothetical protein A2176_06840 [Spirochaetes bacterium RBG_13_51_14]
MANPIMLGSDDQYPVQFEMLRDAKGTLTFNDVRDSQQFATTDKNAFGFITDVIWTRFSITIPEWNKTNWFLEIGYPLLNNIDIYIPDADSNYVMKHYGNHIPFSKRDVDHHTFLIRLNNEPGTYTYYIRFQTESSMNIPLTIHSLKNVISEINVQKTVFGIFYGALLIILAYNLLLALYMKDLTYLSYAVFIVTLILISLELNGYGFQYLWPNAMWMNDLVPFVLFLTIVTQTIFSIMYMNFKDLTKSLQYATYIYLGIIFTFTLASLFLPYLLSIIVGAAFCLPGITLTTLSAIYLMMKKSREAYFYALAFSFLFAGVILTVNNRFGLLPNNILTLWGFQIGTMFSIALFSLGLADRMNMLKKNLEEMNVNLEQKVDERTKELSDAKEEIEAAMEELEAINEQLTTTNLDLQEAQAIHLKDMGMAAHLQSSLLPKRPPQSSMYDIALVYLPKSVVSGDFYDFYQDGNDLIGVGIFDVSGHGIAPGLLTLMAKSIISVTFIEQKKENLTVVAETINNKLISEIKDIDNYITGILLRFKEDRIEYINCAHPDIICKKVDIKRTGKILDKTGKRISGPFLGIDTDSSMDASSFQELTFKLKQGDSVLLYTDSLTESTGDGGAEYGEGGVMTSLQNAPDSTAQNILSHVMNDYFSFTSQRELHDDLTVVLIKRK